MFITVIIIVVVVIIIVVAAAVLDVFVVNIIISYFLARTRRALIGIVQIASLPASG